MDAEIYHLYHSGVAVKTEDKLLVFDYYNDSSSGNRRVLEEGVISKDLIAQEDDVFVFVSHNHHDHFNRVIFEWAEYNKNLDYILSSDVEAKVEDKKNYYQLGQYETLELDELLVETYGSTDQGVSYYVETEELNIFHSGDLNWWHWNKFSAAERKREEEEFKAEVEHFKDKDLDIAFVPVDIRLEEHYYLAGEYFAETVEPELLVPIHFSNNYYITEKFAGEINDLDVESAVIKGRGTKLIYNK